MVNDLQVVLDQHDGAAASDPPHQRDRGVDVAQAHPRRRLVEQQHARLLGECDRQLQRSLAPVGQIHRRLIALAVEADRVEGGARRIVEHGRRLRRREQPARERGLRLQRDLDVVQHAHVREDAGDLEAAHHPHPRDRGRVELGDLGTVEAHAAAGRRREAREDVEQGRLPGAVGADDRMDRPLGDVERDAVQRGEPGVDLDDVARREDRLAHEGDFPAPWHGSSTRRTGPDRRTKRVHETVLEIEAPRVKFGRGAIDEIGAEAAAMGLRRVGLFTDPQVGALELAARALTALRGAGIDVAVFDEVRIEPTDGSFRAAAAFARDARIDGYVSVGGGSTIDTAKAANLYTTYPAPFERYVSAPYGEAALVPGPLAPHIACPTTSGTGSECTGIAIFDFEAHDIKTGISSRRLRPTLGIVDPDATRTLPSAVVACSGFDVLAHALESFTAKPYRQRLRPTTPLARPIAQGANPY